LRCDAICDANTFELATDVNFCLIDSFVAKQSL
jgi:hypothetical protein